ncbi:N-terminal acetyltransferase B complex auxiliary subunit NAA25-like isoform X2 [Macadamia integrifolia]|uniref:N-terminal acetyltransferase B complex auxiliary subunit NAA25-like isoform X2 n=1 Tax=Macadamia integrifolia TaxID=60698 RepID=UPI001C52EEE3|nr:N-terminal acetyltransferase B complex auxiliary subunit NAA25-like isoform X2 [Macadamia integrifolia]
MQPCASPQLLAYHFTKVIEFVQFKDRLEHSNQYLLARLEAHILQLKQKSHNIEEEECILESLSSGVLLLELSNNDGCKPLTFNEDMQSRPWWTPTPDKNYLLGPYEGGSFCHKKDLQQLLTKEKEADAHKIFERRSLLPRMIYLSIQCASSLKENVEANGSMPDNKNSAELKCLLERYAKSLGFPFSDALEEIVAIAEGQKSCEAFNLEMVDWMNFAVFLNAWNLGSHELELPDRQGCLPDSWHIVNSMIERNTLGKLRSLQPIIRSPGDDLSVLLQIVTEPLAWHSLVVQSCVRSMLPSGRRKKKSGPADQLNSSLARVVRGSIQSMHGVIEEVSKWLREQIIRAEDEKLETLLSSIRREGLKEGPGKVLQILEAFASTGDPEIGHRISQALRSWNTTDIARKILASQSSVLSKFLQICESNSKLLQTLKQQL